MANYGTGLGDMAWPSLGGLLGGGAPSAPLPDMSMTPEDKRRQWMMMLQNAGIGLLASGGNWNKGLESALTGWQEGYKAPSQRLEAYGKMNDINAKFVTEAKNMEDLKRLRRDNQTAQEQQGFFSTIATPSGASLYAGGGPTVQNATRASNFQSNPAAVFSDPSVILKGMSVGVDPKQFQAASEATRPYKQDAGSYYVEPSSGRREYMPKLPEGIRMNGATAEAIPGYADASYNINNAQNWARVGPETAIKRAESDYQPTEYIGPGNARYMARRGDLLGNNPTGVRVGDSAMGGKLAELDAGYVNQLRDKHDSAVQGNYLLSQLQNKMEASPGVYGGMFAKGAQGVAGFFNGLGVPFDAQRFQNSKEFEKYSDQLGMSLIKSYVGSTNISDADRQSVLNLMPRLTDDPTARQRLIKVLSEINNRNIGQYIDARQKADANGTLSGDAARMPKPWSPSQATAADIEHTARKYNITPADVRRRLGI